MAIDPDYIDVAERRREFREKYPNGSLQPVNPARPYKVETIGDKTFVVYTAAAYRTPDDTRPGIGVAWEPVPGPTNFTRDSELMNAETSAWGRAIVASLAADTKKIASAQEVRNRAGDAGGASQRPSSDSGNVATPARPTKAASDNQRGAIERLVNKTGIIPTPWPLPDDLTMADASRIIDELQAEPVDPPAVRVASLRKDADQAATEFVGQ